MAPPDPEGLPPAPKLEPPSSGRKQPPSLPAQTSIQSTDSSEQSPPAGAGPRASGWAASESESVGDTPLSPLLKSSLSEELSQSFLSLALPESGGHGRREKRRSGADYQPLEPPPERPLQAGSSDSCFSGTDKETPSTLSSYRSEKTNSTHLDSPSLGPGPGEAGGPGEGAGPGPSPPPDGGSDTDALSDSELLRSPELGLLGELSFDTQRALDALDAARGEAELWGGPELGPVVRPKELALKGRRRLSRKQGGAYLPMRTLLDSKAYAEGFFADEDSSDCSDLSRASSLHSQPHYSSDSSSSTSCYSPERRAPAQHAKPPPPAEAAAGPPAPAEGPAPPPPLPHYAQRTGSTASAKTHARVLSMDGGSAEGKPPGGLSLSKSDLEAHAGKLTAEQESGNALRSLSANQPGWRGELQAEGAVGGGEAACVSQLKVGGGPWLWARGSLGCAWGLAAFPAAACAGFVPPDPLRSA